MHNLTTTTQPSAGHALLDSTVLLAAISLMIRTLCLRQWSSILAGIKIFPYASSKLELASVHQHGPMSAGLVIIVLLQM